MKQEHEYSPIHCECEFCGTTQICMPSPWGCFCTACMLLMINEFEENIERINEYWDGFKESINKHWEDNKNEENRV